MQTDKQARRLGHRVLQVYKDREAATLAAAERAKTTCSEGCASCCYQLRLISFPEAVAIAEHILATSLTSVQTLYMQVFAQLAALEDPGLSPASYFARQLPCIFLRKDNRCGVYEHRPASCRYHYVTSDPKNCAPGAEDPKTLRVDFRSTEEFVKNEGRRVSKQVGVPFSVAPLPVAVVWALRYLQEGSASWQEVEDSAPADVLKLSYWTKVLEGDKHVGSVDG